MTELPTISSERDVEAAFEADLALLFKHSPHCGLSAMAYDEVLRVAEAHPQVPIFLVDVIHERPLSALIERRLGIRHESPQVVVLRSGRPTFDASHRGVTAEALRRALAA